MNPNDYLLLDAARANGQDDTLPEVLAALEHISDDTAAQEWLAASRSYDAIIGQAIRSIEPPAALTLPAPRRINRRQWLKYPLAAAAATVIGGGAYWRWLGQHISLEDLTAQVSTFTNTGVKLSLMSMDTNAVTTWLKDAKAPRALSLPERLDALQRKGCHIYDVSGHKVSLECFLLPGMKELHLYTLRTNELRNPPRAGAATIMTDHGLTIAAWRHDQHTSILLSHESISTVRDLVG